MADIIITIVSGETTELGLSIPGVQGPIGGDTMPAGGVVGNILVKQSSADYDAAWTLQASGLTLISPTFSGTVLNSGVISGGTYTSPIVNGGTITEASFFNGAADGTSLSNATVDACTIDNSSIEDSTITTTTISGCDVVGGTISGVAFSGDTSILTSPIISGGTIDDTVLTGVTINSAVVESGNIQSPILSGTASASGGFVLGGASDLLAFFGSSAVVQPSGIVIPSGGSSVDEVGTVVSGIIIALRNLGLFGA
jgi:hypothetical protein